MDTGPLRSIIVHGYNHRNPTPTHTSHLQGSVTCANRGVPFVILGAEAEAAQCSKLGFQSSGFSREGGVAWARGCGA
jgi:hypothetical protein